MTSGREHWFTFAVLTVLTIVVLGALAVFWELLRRAYPDGSHGTEIFLLAIAVAACYVFAAARTLSLNRWIPRLLLILLVGLAIRLAWADHPGFSFDVSVNKGWAKSAVMLGLTHSYTEQLNDNQLPSYPPLSIMMFAATGHLYQLLWSPTYDDAAFAYHIAIKLPAILADLGLAVLAFFFLRRWSVAAGLAGATIMALHPAAVHDSAIWGQTDSIYTLALLAALFAASRLRWGWSGALLAAACLLKPQSAPVVPVLLLAAALAGRRPFARFVGCGACLTLLVLLPFAIGGTLDDVIAVYTSTVGHYFNGMTHNAFNVWFALYGAGPILDDSTLFFGIASYRSVGFILFAVALAWILGSMRRQLRWSKGKEQTFALALMLTSALACYAFFLLLTQMHERYLFAYVALGLPLILTGRTGIALYVSTSLVFWFNIFDILPVGGNAAVDALHEFPSRSTFAASVQSMLFVLTCVHVRHFFRTGSKAKIGRMRSALRRLSTKILRVAKPLFDA